MYINVCMYTHICSDCDQFSLMDGEERLRKAVDAMASSDSQPDLQDRAAELSKLLTDAKST